MKNCDRPCNANECARLKGECGIDARYLCTEGDNAEGCTGNKALWEKSDPRICSDCCDRWHVQSCNECDPQCSQKECQEAECTLANPWTCTEGHASRGCAAHQQSWSMGMRAPGERQCTKCCDITTCREGYIQGNMCEYYESENRENWHWGWDWNRFWSTPKEIWKHMFD